MSDHSINQRSENDNSIMDQPRTYKMVPPPPNAKTTKTQNLMKPPLSKSTKHEIDFLYKRLGEYQKAMDDILRLPFMNEAEVQDIISKVY